MLLIIAGKDTLDGSLLHNWAYLELWGLNGMYIPDHFTNPDYF
jgi:hypothetical protein